jgi:hypothetical protein
MPAFPSSKHDCALRVTAFPAAGSTASSAALLCGELIEPLLQENVTDEELARIKLHDQVRC